MESEQKFVKLLKEERKTMDEIVKLMKCSKKRFLLQFMRTRSLSQVDGREKQLLVRTNCCYVIAELTHSPHPRD